MRRTRRKRRKAKRLTLPSLDPRGPLRVLALGLAVVGAGYLVARLLDQPVRAIVVEAPFKRVSAMQIEAAVQAGLTGGFLSADLPGMRERVSALPWVDRVRLRRQWPAQIKVSVTEQVAAACWGESGLLNTRGELFIREARHVPAELPRLNGPGGTEWQVAQRYLDVHGRLMTLGVEVTAVRLDDRGSWRLWLGNGLEIRLGREAVDERIDRFFATVVPVIAARLDEVRYVDMRYSNGFAVAWRSAQGPADKEVARDA